MQDKNVCLSGEKFSVLNSFFSPVGTYRDHYKHCWTIEIMKKEKTKNSKGVYNFIFPSGCNNLSIDGYVFSRVDEYIERVQSLQHLITSFSEFERQMNTGTHAVTAFVDLPSKENKPVLEWGDKNATALDDILLLLSIFKHRDVFVMPEPIAKGEGAITADSREYHFGLRTAIKYEGGENETG